MSKDKKSLSDLVETEAVPATEHTVPSLKIEKSRVKERSYVMDLRIHSPASLGYMNIEGIDTAPALVRLAKVKGLDVIAVTDYFSGEYIDRIVDAAKGTPLIVIPGVVIRTALGACADVILSCLFPEGTDSQAIENFLVELGVPEDKFGDRSFVLREDFAKILQTVERFGGVALPSRMDKTPSRKSVIPMLVEQYGFRAFDLAYPDSARFFKQWWPKGKFQLFSFSNANALAQIGSRIAKVKMGTPGFDGIRTLVGRQLTQ